MINTVHMSKIMWEGGRRRDENRRAKRHSFAEKDGKISVCSEK